MENEQDDSKVKANWFPYTSKQEEERGFSPSMEGKGYEEVKIIRDDAFGDRERGWHPGFETLQVREIPRFLLDKFRVASEMGVLPRTYKHYVEEFKRAGPLDEKVVQAFERFTPEVERTHGYQEQKKLFEENILPYLGKLSMKKI